MSIRLTFGLLLVAAALQARATPPIRDHIEFDVLVRASNDEAAPGVPIQIIVRSATGTILFKGATDPDGVLKATQLAWEKGNEPVQIEATLDLGNGMFIGTISSFRSPSRSFCVYLPRFTAGDCGEWGTGLGWRLTERGKSAQPPK